jgi:hypothetical protein
MERCDKCGNAYHNTFRVIMNDRSYTFDCFECAIGKLAPVCSSCGTQIIGHGLENGEDLYCCAGCARNNGITVLLDHVPQP